ncbi:MAG: hypothetical protein IPO27_01720 [Bacteroidetes bacterium]|nr:hypothetical protein [Bacteroidota bacterium]
MIDGLKTIMALGILLLLSKVVTSTDIKENVVTPQNDPAAFATKGLIIHADSTNYIRI